MPRDTPAPLTAMQKIQLASARQKLKLDTAKARQVEEVVSASEIKLNQFGRPIVSYEDMPELDAGDMALLTIEFQHLACPHWAVAKYRPGFGPKNDTRKLSRDSWYFYETGQAILRALIGAVTSDKIPDLLAQLSTPRFDMSDAFKGLVAYMMLEDEAKYEAAILHRTTPEKMEAKDSAELADIRKSLDKRYEAMSKRRDEICSKPV